MAMDRFGELSIFLTVFEKGSFSAAARALALSPSAISKSISRQEARLGVLLFNRNTRAVRPTAEAAALYASGLAVREAMEMAEASVSAFGAVPAGGLRIHSLPMLAKYRLAPILPEFLMRHPQIRLEFQLSVEQPDLARSDVDVILRGTTLRSADLIVRRIGGNRSVLCAAPAYLERRGAPLSPDELGQHNCLARRDHNEWLFRVGSGIQRVHVDGSVNCNESELLLALARAGVGIIWFSEMMIAADLARGDLVRVLPEFEIEGEAPLYAGYRHRRYLNPRIRAFVDFLGERFR